MACSPAHDTHGVGRIQELLRVCEHSTAQHHTAAHNAMQGNRPEYDTPTAKAREEMIARKK